LPASCPKAEQEWDKTGGELGVKFELVSYDPLQRRADIQGVTVVVVVEKSSDSDDIIGATVQASAPGLIPTELAVEHNPTYIGRTPRLHDASVEVAFEIKGPDDVVLALMSREARSAFASLQERVSVKRGVISIIAKGWTAEALVEGIRTAVGLARLLSADRTALARALASNAAADPIPEFRRRCLQVLLQRDSKEGDPKNHAIARKAIAAGLKDPHPAVRLEAASHAGAEALAVLSALVGDDSTPAPLRTTALRRLAGAFPYPKVAPCVVRALTDREEGLLEVAVTVAGEARDRSTFARICELTQAKAPQFAEAVAVALGRLGDVRAEPALLNALGSRSPEAGLAAARALGEVGTIRAIEPLISLAQGSRGSGALKAAARDAIRKIQGRMGDAGAGRLAVVGWNDAQAGLSLVDQGGGISLAEQSSGGVRSAEEEEKEAHERAKG
jgi:hypothetical protein